MVHPLSDPMSVAIASVLIALIAGIPAIIAAIAGYRASSKANETNHKVEEVAHRIDGRMDEILELTRKVAHAAGVIEGKAEAEKERR